MSLCYCLKMLQAKNDLKKIHNYVLPVKCHAIPNKLHYLAFGYI